VIRHSFRITGTRGKLRMGLNDLLAYWNREDLTLDDLVETANAFIKMLAPDRPTKQIKETLSSRTIRFYISRDLVDRPLGQGPAARYGYRHLLQVLAVKSLQGSYLPIRRIQEVLAGMSNEELKGILEKFSKVPVSEPERRFRELFPDSSPMLQESEKHRLGESGQDILLRAEPQAAGSWERFTLLDGVEIHIRSDRKGSLPAPKVKRMMGRLLESLKQR
jgi:DNA-binding transcriptional MerR regulator